jgi:hypothetical protein
VEHPSRRGARKGEAVDRHKKFMLTVIWGISDFHVVDLITSQHSFDSQYSVSNLMAPLIANIYPRGRIPHVRRLHLHLDNCRVHFSNVTEQFITQNQIFRVPNPPYSHNITPSDFWLFGHVKNSLEFSGILWPAGRTFDESEQCREAITAFLDEIQPSELEVVFSHWAERVRCVLENNGDYYHE